MTGKPVYVNPATGERASAPPAPLPDGWTVVKDPVTGELKYVNRATGETSAQRPAPLPPGWVVSEEEPGSYRSLYSGELVAERPTAPALPVGWGSAVSRETGQPYFFPEAEPERAQYEPPVAPELPLGWGAAISRTHGDVYYINRLTGASTLELPTLPAPPVGWEVVVSRSTGEEYYSSMWGESSTEWPAAPRSRRGSSRRDPSRSDPPTRPRARRARARLSRAMRAQP